MSLNSNSPKNEAPESPTKNSSSKGSPTAPPRGWRKQVGFRPKLVIPPPPPVITRTGPTTGGTSLTAVSNHCYDRRKASSFMFDHLHGIKDFTKSGLGVGEKCAYWLYSKLRAWSRRWFTHFFLTIVLVLYTIGGALVFELIEGGHENNVNIDLRSLRNNLIRELRNLSIIMPLETSVPEWEGEAARRMRDYESDIIQWYNIHKLYVANANGKKWTFWNAIVYCGTIYTTIVGIMEASRSPSSCVENVPNSNSNNLDEFNNKLNSDMARYEAMVTPEQVHSACVAKKRRSYIRRRAAHHQRDVTPAREILDQSKEVCSNETEKEEHEQQLQKNTEYNRDEVVVVNSVVAEKRPKTPERRRRRKTVELSTNLNDNNKKNGGICKTNSLRLEDNNKESLADVAQAEMVALYRKTKKGLASVANRGRERFKKVDKEKANRSQSAPNSFTEQEIIESFRRARLFETQPNETSDRKFSAHSLVSEISLEPIVSKPLRSEAEQFLRQRKRQKLLENTEKIVQVIDPSTIIKRKTPLESVQHTDFKISQLFVVLRVYTIRELFIDYVKFKRLMSTECGRIKALRNRCMIELMLIMIFCGLGGFMFKFIEGSFENFYKCGVKRVKRDFIDLLWMRSHNLREDDWKSLARVKLRLFEEQLHASHEAGMKTYSGQRSWGFLNSVVYCLTVITTIGYGHIFPETRTGKALTIVYAIIGIPLFLLALTDFGKLFTRCIKFLWSFVRRLYYTGSCRRVRKTAHVKEIFKGAQLVYDIATFRRPSTVIDPENPIEPTTAPTDTPTTPAISNFEIDDEFNLPISLAIFILVVYILLGGLIYCIWERWDFFDSFYFVFISMSTVGFGDMVPDDPACMIVSIVYLVFGLALMSMCINVVQLKLSDTFSKASDKIGATLGVTVVEDGSIVVVPPEEIEMPKVHDPKDLNTNEDHLIENPLFEKEDISMTKKDC